MTYFTLVNTFDVLDRNTDAGVVLSCHRSKEAAEKADRRIQKGVKIGHGKDAYLPTEIVETERMYRPGVMLKKEVL